MSNLSNEYPYIQKSDPHDSPPARLAPNLKFSVGLPRDLGVRELEGRLTDAPAIRAVLAEPVAFVTAG